MSLPGADWLQTSVSVNKDTNTAPLVGVNYDNLDEENRKSDFGKRHEKVSIHSTVGLAVVYAAKVSLDRDTLGPPQIRQEDIRPDLFMFELSDAEQSRIFRDLWVGISCAVRGMHLVHLYLYFAWRICVFAPITSLCGSGMICFTPCLDFHAQGLDLIASNIEGDIPPGLKQIIQRIAPETFEKSSSSASSKSSSSKGQKSGKGKSSRSSNRGAASRNSGQAGGEASKAAVSQGPPLDCCKSALPAGLDNPDTHCHVLTCVDKNCGLKKDLVCFLHYMYVFPLSRFVFFLLHAAHSPRVSTVFQSLCLSHCILGAILCTCFLSHRGLYFALADYTSAFRSRACSRSLQ